MTARKYGNVIDIVPVLARRAGRSAVDRAYVDPDRDTPTVIRLPLAPADDRGTRPPAA